MHARKLDCTLQLDKDKWINPKRGFSRFINHSCDPNSGIRGRQNVVAMKNIKKGEEVTIDYSITDDDPKWKMECRCGTKRCRKTIRSIQFLPKELIKKYELFIPNFLYKSYKSLHRK